MITNGLLIQYTGERHNEDGWNPPELQMQKIIRANVNKQYELHGEISYGDRHYGYRNSKSKTFINCEQVYGLTNFPDQSQ